MSIPARATYKTPATQLNILPYWESPEYKAQQQARQSLEAARQAKQAAETSQLRDARIAQTNASIPRVEAIQNKWEEISRQTLNQKQTLIDQAQDKIRQTQQQLPKILADQEQQRAAIEAVQKEEALRKQLRYSPGEWNLYKADILKNQGLQQSDDLAGIIQPINKLPSSRPKVPSIPKPSRLSAPLDPRAYNGSDFVLDLAREGYKDAYVSDKLKEIDRRHAAEAGVPYEKWVQMTDAEKEPYYEILQNRRAANLAGGANDAIADAARDILGQIQGEKSWNKRQEIARGQVPFELDPANPSSPLSYDRLKKWGDWTEDAADDPTDPWNPDNPNGVWGDLAKDALTNDDLKRLNDAADDQFWKDLGRELPPGIYRIPQPPPPDNDWNAPFQPLASGTYTIQTSTSYERLNFDGSSGGTQNSTGNDVVSGQLIGFRYETGPTFARVYARLQSGTSVTEDLVGGVAFAPGAGRSPKVSVTSVASNGTPIQPQPKPQPRQEPQPLPAPPTSPTDTPARSPAPTPTPRANPSPTQQPQATPALTPQGTPTLNPQPPAADAPERFPGFTPSGLPIAPIGSPSGLPGTGSSTGGSPNPGLQPPLNASPNTGLRPNLNTTPTPRPSFGPKSNPLRFSNSNPFRNPNPNPAPSTGGGSGTGTGGGEIPTTCRYREDELATVRVQKVQVALNGRQRVEQDLSVHEKFTDFASLHFQQMADIKAGVDRIEKAGKIQRILQTMDTIATLHNAAMLSRNLASTLGDATSTVITAVGRLTGFVDAEQTVDVNEIVQETFDEFMKRSLGEDVWNGTKQNWLKFNRIISSATNIVWSVRSMWDSTREIAEWTAENTGRIGNALKKFGVVGERAYPWMAERINAQTAWQRRFQRVQDGLEGLDDAASSLTSVAGEVVSIQDEFSQIKQQREDFQKALEDALPKPATENKPNKDASAASKAASAGKDVTASDLERNDNATT